MENLLEIVENTKVSEEPWKYLHLQGIEFPEINWKGKTRKIYSHRFCLLDFVPSIQNILEGQPLLDLLEDKFGPLEFDKHVTYYFIDNKGYGLDPHTDVKVFTMLFYQTEAEVCICSSQLRKFKSTTTWAKMTKVIPLAMKPGDALLFKPSDDTWHGVRVTKNIERRSIQHFYLTKEIVPK